MIIDCHIHLSERLDPVWRDNAVPFTAEKALQSMEGPYLLNGKPVRVDIGVIQPAIGLTTYRPGGKAVFAEQHRDIVETVRKYPKRFVGCMTLNPRIGLEEGLEELRRLVREEGFRAVKLHSIMHLYRPDVSPDLINPIVEESIKLNIPVLVHTGDPPYSVPSQFLPMIEAYPQAKIVLLHFGVQTSGFPFEVIHIARKNPNVYIEISRAPYPRVREAVSIVGADRVIYGSDVPAHEQGSYITAMGALCGDRPIGVNLSYEDRDKLLGGNMARLMNLDLNKYR